MAFPDTTRGWVVANDGTVLASGASWTAQSSGTSTHLDGVSFANASDGWPLLLRLLAWLVAGAAFGAGPDRTIRLDLGLGNGTGEAFGCDLTEGYVIENSEYTT